MGSTFVGFSPKDFLNNLSEGPPQALTCILSLYFRNLLAQNFRWRGKEERVLMPLGEKRKGTLKPTL